MNYNNSPCENQILREALALAELGFGVLPLKPRSKRPLIRWRELQRTKLSENALIEHFGRTPDANLGVVTGAVSSLLVLDCDAPDALKRLGYGVPVTPIVETARGRHFYFELPDGKIRCTKLADGLDLRCEGGYVVAPPSLHPCGKRYEWVIPPWEAEPAPCPAWVLDLLHRQRAQQRALSEIARGVPEGRRNVSSAQLIGYLLAHLPFEQWELVVWPLVRGWNLLHCKPPLSERDLRWTFESIARKELKKRPEEQKWRDIAIKSLNAARERFSLRELSKLVELPKSTLANLCKADTSTSQRLTPKHPTPSSWTVEEKKGLRNAISVFECPKFDVGGR